MPTTGRSPIAPAPAAPAPISLSERDFALLRFLDRTPATVQQIVRVSVCFGEPFRDERRARERLTALAGAGLLRPYSLGGRSHSNYYKLCSSGFRTIHPNSTDLPSRSYFEPIPLGLLAHTLTLADVIVKTMVSANQGLIDVTTFHRENALNLKVGSLEVKPDSTWRFSFVGRFFNVLFELDNGTEPLDSHHMHAIRQKIQAYEAYQNFAMDCWKRDIRGKVDTEKASSPRPYFRVCFLTKTAERAANILYLARRLTTNPRRKLVYAAPQAEYLSANNALREPIFCDHHGQWTNLVDSFPLAEFLRKPLPLIKPKDVGQVFITACVILASVGSMEGVVTVRRSRLSQRQETRFEYRAATGTRRT